MYKHTCTVKSDCLNKKHYMVRLNFTTNSIARQRKILATSELEESYFKCVLKNKYNVDAQVSLIVRQSIGVLTHIMVKVIITNLCSKKEY